MDKSVLFKTLTFYAVDDKINCWINASANWDESRKWTGFFEKTDGSHESIANVINAARLFNEPGKYTQTIELLMKLGLDYWSMMDAKRTCALMLFPNDKSCRLHTFKSNKPGVLDIDDELDYDYTSLSMIIDKIIKTIT